MFAAKNRNKIKLSIKKKKRCPQKPFCICILYKFYRTYVAGRFGRTRETGYLHFIYFFGRFHEWTFPSVVSSLPPPDHVKRIALTFFFFFILSSPTGRLPLPGWWPDDKTRLHNTASDRIIKCKTRVFEYIPFDKFVVASARKISKINATGERVK